MRSPQCLPGCSGDCRQGRKPCPRHVDLDDETCHDLFAARELVIGFWLVVACLLAAIIFSEQL